MEARERWQEERGQQEERDCVTTGGSGGERNLVSDHCQNVLFGIVFVSCVLTWLLIFTVCSLSNDTSMFSRNTQDVDKGSHCGLYHCHEKVGLIRASFV